MSRLVILTGASRGMGRALAVALLQREGTRLLTLSRRPDAALEAEPRAAGSTLEQWALDLAQPVEAAARLEAWLAAQGGNSVSEAALVNNAALLTPPGPVESVEADLLSAALRVGLEAPVLLTRAFLRATEPWRVPRKVLNISSGLGRRAMAASAPYCAVKAGLDHFTRALALDEALKPLGARVVSLAPGVIDTDMQVQLRGGDPAHFPDHDRFVQLRAQGLLDSPQAAAAKLLAYLERPDFGQQPVADVREP
ncbi:SDR family NAD(P)-dependent oxidoreductase [Azohydromonas caseinilytica]|uniref:SDR family NAD(P)-dependent oxidoreductase n=1 Tax=Azohydromonas caseinilytica TaxID=2728836 RepID=A0A848F3X4_9BURK|nr:SDR family NAD(P)-dependent oxidoreductase [Azohydromonas caseinilytica]NML14082.1 SDR family NAD(P)-dependent oxidoreductase [Azohydromonas caseinilytica]